MPPCPIGHFRQPRGPCDFGKQLVSLNTRLRACTLQRAECLLCARGDSLGHSLPAGREHQGSQPGAHVPRRGLRPARDTPHAAGAGARPAFWAGDFPEPELSSRGRKDARPAAAQPETAATVPSGPDVTQRAGRPAEQVHGGGAARGRRQPGRGLRGRAGPHLLDHMCLQPHMSSVASGTFRGRRLEGG